ncbi:MAG TPA: CehA/McbA family metallohydrolase [Candidatus Latescibacteria bacterium]|nr:CehA/McbA family metallohydrolase [Candidatus Latescibacterota bacterium]HJP33099.1 CehA/McbA family metallohydrolase [Candidatus Latescibacterota bacterium]
MFDSPYLDQEGTTRWLRGNHHGHSTLSDGHESPGQLLRAYEEAGYDYLALSEHDLFADPADYQTATSMCLLPAVEVTSAQGQSLMHLGAAHELPPRQLSAPEIMAAVHDAGGLFIFDHPNWKPVPEYATDELLDSMADLRGMEIYCGVIERLPGEAKATDRWDRQLSRGRRLWGHGTDDQHEATDRFIAWNCVQWPKEIPVDAAGVIEALGNGRFYATTGVTIARVGTTRTGAAASSSRMRTRSAGSPTAG